jgi:hypothetical protein
MDYVLATLKLTKQLKDYGLYEIVLIFSACFFLYKYSRDRKDTGDQILIINNRIAEHERKANNIFDNINKTIEQIKDTLAKHFISKPDLETGDYKHILFRIEGTAHVVFSEFSRLVLDCKNDECDGCQMIPSIISLLGQRRRESFNYWEELAIPRRILNIVEKVDDVLFTKHIKYLNDIHTTCMSYKDDQSRQETEVRAVARAYEAKVIEEWKTTFIEKINLG